MNDKKLQRRQVHADMPKLIPAAGFNRKLNLPSENSELTTLFLAAGTHQFSLPGYEVKEGYQFIKSGKKQQYRLVTTGNLPETVYLVELCFRNDIVAGQTSCTQIKVWRTTNEKHQSAVADLPRHFFRWLPVFMFMLQMAESRKGHCLLFRILNLFLNTGVILVGGMIRIPTHTA